MGTSPVFYARYLILLWLAAMLASGGSFAAGPIETSVFAVQGVEVDVTDTDATTAKNKALIAAQVKAFNQLAERLGNPSLVENVAKFEEKRVLPFLKSLSIEEESISPGRYKGKLTVRFLPAKVRALYGGFGVNVGGEQGPSFLVLAIWKDNGSQVLWVDNPWHQAWVDLRAEQSLIPLIVPLGDLEDSGSISVTDVLNNDAVKIEKIRRRYDVSAVLVAFAEPADGGGVHATMSGNSPLGKLVFDKIYTAESGILQDSVALAAQRFHGVMVDKFKSGATKATAEQEAAKAKQENSKRKTVSVSVPFAGPSQWNGLRSRLLSTPGVLGLDVSSLAADGAVVSLTYAGNIDEIESSLQASGLRMSRVGDALVVEPF